jgi:hypothetical protein
MKSLVTALAGATVAAVVAATFAAAAPPTQGRLIVVNPANRTNALGQTTLVSISAPGTYRTTVYVPLGYRAPGGLGTLGKEFGKATVYVGQADGSRITLNGTLTRVDPAAYANSTCATDRAAHDVVWLVKAQQTKGTAAAEFPVFVDRITAGKETGFASYKLQWCASSAANANVVETDLTLGKLFVNPVSTGMYIWRAIYEPAAADGKTIASDQSVSVASAVPLNTQVTTNVSKTRRTGRWVNFSGNVTVANHPLAAVKVMLFVGHQKHVALNRPKAVVKTKADGSYRVLLRLGPGHWWVRTKATSPALDITPGGGCTETPGEPRLGAKGCVDATLTAFEVLNPTVRRVY